MRQGFSEGHHAPGRCSDPSRCTGGDSYTEPYLVAHNVLRAHARAVALFRVGQDFQYRGRIGIVLNGEWAEPPRKKSGDSPSSTDAAAAQKYMEQQVGWFADPIFTGDYPSSMRDAIGTRLPRFTKVDAALLKGSVDFFALNFYNAFYVTPLPDDLASDPATPFWSKDLGLLNTGSNPYTEEDIGLVTNNLMTLSYSYYVDATKSDRFLSM